MEWERPPRAGRWNPKARPPPITMSEATALPANPLAPTETPVAYDWREIFEKPEGRAALAVLAGLVLAFLPYWKKLAGLWFEPDSLYSHGPLIPLMAAYILYERWPKLRQIPVRGFALAAVGMVPLMYVVWVASRTVMMGTLSGAFLIALSLSVLFIGGWRWLFATVGPILYLVFCMPFWTSLVDRMTQPLQALSTDMAMRMLDLSGLHPLRIDTTTIYLDRFQLNVAAACSGAKTTLALLAFAVFFIMLNRGRWYSAVALLVLLLPFSLAINGLRIALVGIVGNAFGQSAGMAFHDYGGYGVLIVCFLLLAQLTRLLGFKQ